MRQQTVRHQVTSACQTDWRISLPRSQAADVTLDHQSLSRQHAAICYHKSIARWLVMDLNSTHGTLCDGKPVPKVTRLCRQQTQ